MNTHKSTEHDTVIAGQRKMDGSLIWKCRRCGKVSLGLIGPCAAYGPRGRRRKRQTMRNP